MTVVPTSVSLAAEGIHRLSIPTPFLVGRVNLYLVEGPPLTLVDTGPNSGTSLDCLERSLREIGRRLEDIERIVLTHQHVDHVGLAGVIAGRAGAEVAMPVALAPYLADWRGSAELDDELAAQSMMRHGLPNSVGDAVKQVAGAYRAFGDSVTATEKFEAGDRVQIGGVPFQSHWRPGHSPTDTIFVREDGLMIGGDHLLPEISSNPVLSRDFVSPQAGDSLVRYRSLPAYLRSLEETAGMDADLILPGHGEPFRGHAELIAQRMRLHHERADKMLAALEPGPQDALQLAQAIWGETASAQPFLTFSEVLGHMDVLLDEGKVVEHHDPERGAWLFQLS